MSTKVSSIRVRIALWLIRWLLVPDRRTDGEAMTAYVRWSVRWSQLQRAHVDLHWHVRDEPALVHLVESVREATQRERNAAHVFLKPVYTHCRLHSEPLAATDESPRDAFDEHLDRPTLAER